MLKTIGYIVSSASVLLLGAVAWKGIEPDPPMQACLLAGMATSLIGMFCRWLSYRREHWQDLLNGPIAGEVSRRRLTLADDEPRSDAPLRRLAR